VGIHGDFFRLGGHSLLALQIVARIDSTMKVNIPIRILFEAPTIAQFALAVEENGKDRSLEELDHVLNEVERV
jgi:hypothetical protein